MGEPVKSLTYEFRLQSGAKREFTVRLRASDLLLELPARSDYPAWTRLESNQCPNCPLQPGKVPRCPAAVSLMDLIEFFKDCLSTEVAEISIRNESREYRGTKSLQTALSSLIGLHMATSGCPVLDQLRPMVYIHLPFATLKETMFRAMSMYLVAQFLRQRNGKKPDWELKGLLRIYEDVNVVNRAFIRRLTDVQAGDASLNAIASLDCFAAFTTFSLERNHLAELERLFAAYLEA
jgi:hypothetical protein